MPVNIVITSLRIAGIFPYFSPTSKADTVTFKKAGSGYLVWNDSQRVLVCKGGTDESDFGDPSFVLCNAGIFRKQWLVRTGV